MGSISLTVTRGKPLRGIEDGERDRRRLAGGTLSTVTEAERDLNICEYLDERMERLTLYLFLL